jgi:adenine C2-methylase RlmN of 23S rRNA A2503 and tRNA A37
LIATAPGKAPEGHAHWTLRLLADELKQLQVVEAISFNTVRRALKNKLMPWNQEILMKSLPS